MNQERYHEYVLRRLREEREFKEACRLFWMVKGHLNAPKETILDSADGYLKRLWGNHEACYHEEGFEEAYSKMFLDLE